MPTILILRTFFALLTLNLISPPLTYLGSNYTNFIYA
jgi:hypothetical protein